MNFSNELIDEFKKAKGIKTDAEVAKVLPEMHKSNLSKIRKGLENRHLNEEQALFIAHECGLCTDWVLVNLAESVTKSNEAKEIWQTIAKKLNKSITAAVLVLSLVFCGFGDNDRKNAVFS